MAAFHTLYVANSAAPEVIAVIQPGDGFGGNWTSFGDERQALARVVLTNPAGAPDLLLYGGMGSRAVYGHAQWSSYDEFVCAIENSPGRYVGLWRRQTGT